MWRGGRGLAGLGGCKGLSCLGFSIWAVGARLGQHPQNSREHFGQWICISESCAMLSPESKHLCIETPKTVASNDSSG